MDFASAAADRGASVSRLDLGGPVQDVLEVGLDVVLPRVVRGVGDDGERAVRQELAKPLRVAHCDEGVVLAVEHEDGRRDRRVGRHQSRHAAWVALQEAHLATELARPGRPVAEVLQYRLRRPLLAEADAVRRTCVEASTHLAAERAEGQSEQPGVHHQPEGQLTFDRRDGPGIAADDRRDPVWVVGDEPKHDGRADIGSDEVRTLELEVIQDCAEECAVLVDGGHVGGGVGSAVVRQVDGDEVESLGQSAPHVPVGQHAHGLGRRHQHLGRAGRARCGEAKPVAPHDRVVELHRHVSGCHAASIGYSIAISK